MGEMLKGLGRDKVVEGQTNFVISKVKGKASGQPVQEVSFSNDGRFIIADYSQKDRDKNPGDQQIPWDQLVFKQYSERMETANEGNLLNLESIGRSNIANKATEKTINTALSVPGNRPIALQTQPRFLRMQHQVVRRQKLLKHCFVPIT